MISGRNLKADILKTTTSVARLYALLLFSLVRGHTGNRGGKQRRKQATRAGFDSQRKQQGSNMQPTGEMHNKYFFGLTLLSAFCEFSAAYHTAVVANGD
jgi:hypothetical protein